MSRHVERNARSLQRVLNRKQESNEEFELKEMMSRLTMDTIASTGFGLDIDTLGQPDNEFFKSAKAFIAPNITMLLLTMLFPFLGKVLEKVGLSVFSPRATRFFEKVVDAALQERRESENAGKMHDFIDLMLNAEDKMEGETDEKDKIYGSLSRNEILRSLSFVTANKKCMHSS
ncbi:cytochrome P450 3026D3 [Elysia marginata]|uniref:Cytochrome P450 3026D3 n=1 Tax=Elysia marginata TaxID=1093978 RepID=A0AAV4ET34_9GAST|nr:cytochrome P450 3026D3 [Elysia marginata]